MRASTLAFHFVVLLLTCLAATAVPQTPKCVRIENVDFFVPLETGKVHWGESEINGLIADREESNDTSWLIPPVIKQLQAYKPACGLLEVDQRFNLLIKLYSHVRSDKRLEGSIDERLKLEIIRKDFYRLLADDKSFSKLIFTFDDGPILGELVSDPGKLKISSSREIAASFGKLIVGQARERVLLTAIDKKNRLLWSRYLKGTNPDRYLKNVNLSERVSITEGRLATKLSMFADGEELIAYLRPDGRFMYYTHSW